MTIKLLIRILDVLETTKIDFLIESTTAQLYQKQYWCFGCMTSIKMQTIVIYGVVTVMEELMND